MIALFYVTMTVFILVCVILILLILIQKGRGGGLASAFGGAGGQTAFGSKTGDVLTWATSIIFAIFVVLAVCLNLLSNHIDSVPGASINTPIATNVPAMPSNPPPSLPTPAGQSIGTSAQPTTITAAPAMAVSPTTVPAAARQISTTTLPTTLP